MGTPDNVPKLEFEMSELKAIVSILHANIRQSQRFMCTYSEIRQEQEHIRIAILVKVKTDLEGQVASGSVGLVLSLEETHAVIQALNVYRDYIKKYFLPDAQTNSVLTNIDAWLERLNNIF